MLLVSALTNAQSRMSVAGIQAHEALTGDDTLIKSVYGLEPASGFVPLRAHRSMHALNKLSFSFEAVMVSKLGRNNVLCILTFEGLRTGWSFPWLALLKTSYMMPPCRSTESLPTDLPPALPLFTSSGH